MQFSFMVWRRRILYLCTVSCVKTFYLDEPGFQHFYFRLIHRATFWARNRRLQPNTNKKIRIIFRFGKSCEYEYIPFSSSTPTKTPRIPTKTGGDKNKIDHTRYIFYESHGQGHSDFSEGGYEGSMGGGAKLDHAKFIFSESYDQMLMIIIFEDFCGSQDANQK